MRTRPWPYGSRRLVSIDVVYRGMNFATITAVQLSRAESYTLLLDMAELKQSTPAPVQNQCRLIEFRELAPGRGHWVLLDGLVTPGPGTCRVCGCTDEDCRGCIAATGHPCGWVDGGRQLCSACEGSVE